MKAPLSSWGVFLLGAAAWLGRASGGSIWDRVLGVKSCDDYEQGEDVTASGVITFLRPLQCDTPLVFHIHNETVVRCHDGINTTNVHFIVHPEATLTLTARFIVMRRDEARHDSEQPGKLSPCLEALLNRLHGRPTTHRISSDSAAGARTDVSSVNSVRRDSGGRGTEDGDDAHVDSGVQAARHASNKLPLPRHLTTDDRVSKRILHVLRKVKLQQGIKSNSVSHLLKGSARHHPITKHVVVGPRDPRVKRPTWALQFGQSLTGTVKPIEGRSAVRPGVDGSLCFGKKHQSPASSDNGGGDSSEPGVMQATTLLASDPETARKVLGMLKGTIPDGGGKGVETVAKKDTFGGWLPRGRPVQRNSPDKDDAKSGKKQETAGDWLPGVRRAKRSSSDSAHDMSRKKQETAGGWLPWARWPKSNINSSDSIARESANPEEICDTISNKDCVRGTVDGTTVLSNSDRYKWDWLNRLPWARPKDGAYQLHVTETGMEVRLGKKKVWGISADEWMG